MFKDYLLEHGFKTKNLAYHVLDGLFDEMMVVERVKVRKEKVSFDGNGVDYKNLCNFRVYNEKGTYIFIPRLSRMNGKKLSENCKEVDLTTLINIGIAECFGLIDNLLKSDYGVRKCLCSYLYKNYQIIEDDTTYLKVSLCDEVNHDILMEIFKDKICLRHIYLGEFMYRFKPENSFESKRLNDIRNILDALAYYDAQSYALVLGDLLAFLMTFREFLFDLNQIQVWGKTFEDTLSTYKKMSKCKGLRDTAESYYNRFSNKDVEELCVDEFPYSAFGKMHHMVNELNFGAINYKYEDNIGKISDARQLAIAFVGLLGYGYLSFSSSTPINFLDLDYIQYKINQCLGDDLLSRVIIGEIDLNDESSFSFSDWRKSVDIDICKYEEFIVWKKYNKSSLKWEDIVDVKCFDLDDYSWTSSYGSCELLDFIVVSISPNIKKNLLDNLNKYDSAIKNLNKEVADLKLRLKDKVKVPTIDNSVIEQKDAVIEGLQKQIEELERINASKSEIIANKSNEIDSLNNEITKIFGDDYVPEEVSLEVSQEDKIKFLNDFNFVFVNGLVGFEKSLQNIGITNYRIINTCGTSFNISQSYKADFVIYCTNFISHAVCNSVKSVYGSQAEGCYYTGTNIDKMVDFMYDYVNNYLNS